MTEPGPSERYRRRLKGFGYHLAGYFLVMVVLVPVNLLLTPETPWFVWPMVGWGPILAIHAAWVMGLFDILGGKK
ncbi:MAG: 2TM domain-containing protein [Gammaproteobacteria bacterium]